VDVSERAVLSANKRDETEELVGDNKNAIACYMIVTKFLNSSFYCLSHSYTFACLISFTKFITHRVDT
jgi:hypothetical protein